MNVTIDNVISDGNTAILGVTAGIHIMNSHFVSIKDTTCSLNYGFGILVESTIPSFGLTHISISDSYIDSNNNGIVWKGVGSSIVEDSVIQHNTNGIHMTNGGGLLKTVNQVSLGSTNLTGTHPPPVRMTFLNVQANIALAESYHEFC